MDILTIGEALIDFKQSDKLSFDGFEGGSPMNVAVAAARLGPQVGFAGQVSNDLFAKVLREHLATNKVDTRYLLEHDSPSTLAFVAEIDGHAHFSFMNNGAADTLYNPQPRPKFSKDLKYLMFGSISLLSEPTASSIEDIVALHQNRSTIIFDPNVRPALIPNKNEYLTKLKKWLSLAHIVKLSTQDLEWLYPERSAEDIALDWLEPKAIAIIVTDGANGVRLFRKNKKVLSAKSVKAEVVDTVGAGDTFTGALMVALLEADYPDLVDLPNEVWQETLNFASYAAGLNCARAGANPPTRKELEAYLQNN